MDCVGYRDFLVLPAAVLNSGIRFFSDDSVEEKAFFPAMALCKISIDLSRRSPDTCSSRKTKAIRCKSFSPKVNQALSCCGGRGPCRLICHFQRAFWPDYLKTLNVAAGSSFRLPVSLGPATNEHPAVFPVHELLFNESLKPILRLLVRWKTWLKFVQTIEHATTLGCKSRASVLGTRRSRGWPSMSEKLRRSMIELGLPRRKSTAMNWYSHRWPSPPLQSSVSLADRFGQSLRPVSDVENSLSIKHLPHQAEIAYGSSVLWIEPDLPPKFEPEPVSVVAFSNGRYPKQHEAASFARVVLPPARTVRRLPGNHPL